MKENKYQPTISIVVPTYNEENNIKRCLNSIFSQNYPQQLLEVFVVDNGSKDKTLEIAKHYQVKILHNKIVKDAQFSKMMAFKQAQGELFLYLDADIELRGKDWFTKMIYPLLDDQEIIGSFTRKYQIPGDNSLNRFLTHEPLQRDPVYEFFSPSIQSTVKEKRGGYYLCYYQPNKVAPAGRCLYRRKELLKTPIAKMEKFMELDNLVILAKNGYNKFAYVPKAGVYHHHAQSLQNLLKKRLRNIKRNYLPDYSRREYRWFDLQKKQDLAKIVFWVIYANLIIPAFFRGCLKTIKYRDWNCLWYEPFLTLLLTDVIIYGFLSNKKGRKIISNISKLKWI